MLNVRFGANENASKTLNYALSPQLLHYTIFPVLNCTPNLISLQCISLYVLFSAAPMCASKIFLMGPNLPSMVLTENKLLHPSNYLLLYSLCSFFFLKHGRGNFALSLLLKPAANRCPCRVLVLASRGGHASRWTFPF